MPILLRCPVPKRCGKGRLWPWHISEAAGTACLSHQHEECKDRAERSKQAVAAAEQRRRDSIEQRRKDEEEKERAEATAAHTPVKPVGLENEVLTRNGERQLIVLAPCQLELLGLLTSWDMFRANELLRNRGRLAGEAGKLIGDCGYGSMQEFVDVACDVFYHLDHALDLDEEITLFRGIGLPRSPDDFYPDIAGIRQHLDIGKPWHNTFLDNGFGFAATSPQEAMTYKGKARGEYPPRDPVLLELVVRHGLCLPEPEHRSKDLFWKTYYPEILRGAMGQVIFPLGTRWEVLGVEKKSQYGVPLVRMKQLISAPVSPAPPI